VLHREAIAGKGVGGVGFEDFIESGDLVHVLMVASTRSRDSARWGLAI
jgi:hypothetical protein